MRDMVFTIAMMVALLSLHLIGMRLAGRHWEICHFCGRPHQRCRRGVRTPICDSCIETLRALSWGMRGVG